MGYDVSFITKKIRNNAKCCAVNMCNDMHIGSFGNGRFDGIGIRFQNNKRFDVVTIKFSKQIGLKNQTYFQRIVNSYKGGLWRY